MSDPDARLASDLSLVVIRLARHLRFRRADSPVSLTQLSALATLLNEGAMTPGALAARERVQPPSMTRVIASLAELGLVERSAHPTDGRQVVVSLSDVGADIVQADRSAREEWLREHLADFTPDQRAVLRQATDLLSALVNENG
ncbi:MarR family winged helix-turn-helix transcriptional regulator [Mycobacteroides abscessus]